LVLLIEGDIIRLDGGAMLTALDCDGCRVEVEVVSVERHGLGGLVDLEIDLDLALICPWFGGLEVEEGDAVVGWLDAG